MVDIPIFIINMQEDIARMESMKTQFKFCQLKYQRIKAVDGRKISAADRGRLYSDFWYRLIHGHSASAGEVGVGLSHRKIYRKMVDENISAAVIFEDDVKLLPEFAALLTAIEQSTREFDMVQLFSFREPDRLIARCASGNFYIKGFSNLHASSAAYILRQSGATKLLSIPKLRTLSDRWCWMSAMSGLKCCAIWPFPVVLDENLSAASSVYKVSHERVPEQRKISNKSFLWRSFVLPWMNLLKIGILRARGL